MFFDWMVLPRTSPRVSSSFPLIVSVVTKIIFFTTPDFFDSFRQNVDGYADERQKDEAAHHLKKDRHGDQQAERQIAEKPEHQKGRDNGGRNELFSLQETASFLSAAAFFQREQPFLDVQSARVAGQGTVFAHHPVAGHEDGHGVPVVGHAHRPAGLWIAEPCGDLPVGTGLAVGDFAKRRPVGALEGRALQRKRQIKRAPLPGEIFGQLPRGPPEQGRLRLRVALRLFAAQEEEGADAPPVLGDADRPEGGFGVQDLFQCVASQQSIKGCLGCFQGFCRPVGDALPSARPAGQHGVGGVVRRRAPQGGGPAGRGVAVGAAAGAGVVRADVDAFAAAAGGALAGVLRGLDGAAEDPAHKLRVDAGRVPDAEGRQVDRLRAGKEGEAVPRRDLPEAPGHIQALRTGHLAVGAARVAVGVDEAEDATFGRALQRAAERLEAFQMPCRGIPPVHHDGIVPPDDPFGAEPPGERPKGADELLLWGQAGFRPRPVGGQRELEIKRVARRFDPRESVQHGGGVLCPKDDAVDRFGRKRDAAQLAGVMRVRHQDEALREAV